MEKDIFRDRALFIDMEMNFMVVCAAQTARSMDEAKAMYESLVQDEIAMRYNRFALCCFSADRSHTSFDFCIYYNPEKQELYVFFDDITNGEMCMDGKRLPPLSATIKLKDYDNAMNSFLDNQFYPAMKRYYAGTKFDIDKLLSHNRRCEWFALYHDGDAGGFNYIKNCHKLKVLTILFNPDSASREYIYNDEYTDLDKLLELSEGERTGRKAELDYKTQNTILKLLKIEEESGNYVYLYDGRYIWSIRRQIFNEHLENKEIQKNYLVMEGNI